MGTKDIKRDLLETGTNVLEDLRTLEVESGQVIVHLMFENGFGDNLIRIWPTTFLYDLQSSHRSSLEWVENISLFPVWTHCPAYSAFRFTLIFSGLPGSCRSFDLVEECKGQGGGFEIRNIGRNDKDVYYLILN